MLPQKSGEHIAIESQQWELVKITGTPNVLELMAVKFAILTFTKNLSNVIIHIQMDNKVAQSCLLKIEGRHSLCKAFKNQHVNLALSLSWDHIYCRTFTKQIECPSRLGV